MGSNLNDSSKKPTEASLAEALGESGEYWDAVGAILDRECGDAVREWKFYGEKYGWHFKVTRSKRALLYLIPKEGSFTAAMALDEDAVAAVRASDLPAELIAEIDGAAIQPEGRPARVEVTSSAAVLTVEKLLAIKLAN